MCMNVNAFIKSTVQDAGDIKKKFGESFWCKFPIGRFRFRMIFFGSEMK